jgi:hypothetical protein
MNTKTAYVRNDKKKLQITVVSTVTTLENGFRVDAAWTFRNSKDLNFVKRIGRELALGRLTGKTPEYSCSVVVPELNHIDIMCEILEAIYFAPTTPERYIELICQRVEFYNAIDDLEEADYYC